MKKLLLILLIAFAGINCQAQSNRCFATCDNIKYLITRIDENTKTEAAALNMFFDQITKLENKVNSLEKRITELEYNCLVTKVDSMIYCYESGKDSLNASTTSLTPVYTKQYRVEPFKIKK